MSVLELHPDYNLAVRCLEYICLKFSVIIPERARLDVRLLAQCHHYPDNVYPSLAIVFSEVDYRKGLQICGTG